MDTIIEKFIKTVPLGIVMGCIMIKAGILESIFYPGFNKNITTDVKRVFKTFTIMRIPQGTIITKKSQIPLNCGEFCIENVSKFLGYPCSVIESTTNRIEVIVRYGKIKDLLLTMYCDKINKSKKFLRDMSEFINRLNKKVKKNLDIQVLINKHYTVKKIRQVIDSKKKISKDEKSHIAYLLRRYGYRKALEYDINTHRKDYALLLKLCELEQMGFFSPTTANFKDKIIDDNFITQSA